MQRRSLLLGALGFLGLTGLHAFGRLPLVGSAVAVDPPPPLGSDLPKGLTYQRQLETGLKARRPSDFTFIAEVIAKIEAGELPQKLVNETFDYARGKSSYYPFIYFQFAIRKRAEKLGVTL
ncbi:MAG: hypothetical protein C0483_05065 [Pirellula sp.]|nr:hypothetical protein [Pirellula sp.]